MASVIKGAGSGTPPGAGGRQHNFLRLLVVSEVALALPLPLVIGATLALHSFARLREVNLDFRPDHLLTLRVNFPSGKFQGPEQFIPYVRQIVTLTRAIPGVRDAAASLYPPLSGFKALFGVRTHATSQGSAWTSTEANFSTPGYFRTLGVSFLAGRDFTDADTSGAPDVYIVNQAFAQEFFGHTNPIGKRIWTTMNAKYDFEPGLVVGEIGNIRDQVTKDAPEPDFFAAYDQKGMPGGISLAVRTRADPLAVVSAIQDRISSLDKAQPIDDVESMDQLVANSNAAPRFQTFLLSLFGALGLLLALVGIYGVTSHFVTQRTHEIGIRIALGAEQRQVMHLILAQGLKLALIGIAIGIGASFVLTRLMSSLVFEALGRSPTH